MTVINPSSISGITSITMPSGDGNVLTIHTNDGVERFRIDSSGNVKVGSACTISQDGDVFFTGVTTATTFTGAHSGSGANLTNLPAANLTGALPAISGANLTGIAATDNVRTGILDVAGVSTFRNTMNVGAAVTISESGIEASGIGITVANINGGQVGGRRNLIINGAMNVAQRGTSSTSGGYQTLDRYKAEGGANGQTTTQSQQDLSSSDTPYTLGFRKYFRVALGSAGTANSNAYVEIQQRIEAQNVAKSGWNYTSSSSYIILQFWFRASTNQTFYAYFYAFDGTPQVYTFSFTASGDNTWTKVIKKIPGNSNLTFDNNNNAGLQIKFLPYYGTDYSNNKTLNEWSGYDGTNQLPDMASTWLTTGTPTFDLTGLQLEVGSQATAFEHLSVSEELNLCKRYCQKFDGLKIQARMNGSTNSDGYWQFPTMRATPSFSSDVSSGKSMEYGSIARTVANVYGGGSSPESAYSRFNISGSGTSGYASYNNLATGSYYLLESEL